jgi:magnesium transporter
MECQIISFNLNSREIQQLPFPSELEYDNADLIYWIHLNSFDLPKIEPFIKNLSLYSELKKDLEGIDSLPIERHDETSLSIVVRYCEPTLENVNQLEPSRLFIFLTEKYCLTIAEEDIPAIYEFSLSYRSEFRFAKTPGFILFLILDNLVDDYAAVVSKLENISEEIDLSIQKEFTKELNYTLLDFKRGLVVLKRVVASTRDILMRISGRKIIVISESCRLSLVDIYLHSQAVVGELDVLRELAANSLDAYNTALAQKMNEVMKVLTIFSSIILPMSFIASVYGMNFEHMPELKWEYGYLFAIGIMAFFAVILLAYFKKREWF